VQQLDMLWVSGSIPLTSTTQAPVTKLANVSLSKGEFCGFKSHPGYQSTINNFESAYEKT
jgi:hypothetical protein